MYTFALREEHQQSNISARDSELFDQSTDREA